MSQEAVDASMGQRVRRMADHSRVWALVIVLAVQAVTMPRFFYPGDNFASRAQCASLLVTGELGIPYDMKPTFAGFLEKRGQYFFENDEAQKLYAKYGIAYTLFYLPPLLAEKVWAGELDYLCTTDSQLLFLNVWHLLLSLGVAVYVYAMAGFYTRRRWARAVFLLALFYGTFVWHYLRAPTHEILQMLPFVAANYYFLTYLRSAETAPDPVERRWGALTAAILLAGVVILMKTFFLLLMGSFWLFAGTAGRAGVGLRERVATNVRRSWRRHVVYLGLPTAMVAMALLGANLYRFGHPFESGYNQYLTGEGEVFTNFRIARFAGALRGFFGEGGNANLFIHNPLVVLALLGFGRFHRQVPADARFLGFLFVAAAGMLCCYAGWTGAWCYGPRHLMLWSMLWSLPALVAVEQALTRLSRPVAVAVATGLVCLLGWSFSNQWAVNSRHYFVFEQMDGVWGKLVPGKACQYTQQHKGILYKDLIAYRNGRRSDFPWLTELLAQFPSTHWIPLERNLGAYVRRLGEPNYFLFRGDF